MYRTRLIDELNIRIILRARKEWPDIQASLEKVIGLDLSEYERPYANLTDAQLHRYILRSER